jgi:hypothetical protein
MKEKLSKGRGMKEKLIADQLIFHPSSFAARAVLLVC